MGWSPADIPDQTGRVAVVTGANSGLGFEVARKLGGAGARVVLACRDQTRGRDALGRLREAVPGASFQLVRLDLADLGSIRECAEEIAIDHAGIDVLINNAGVMALPRRATLDGFEMHFGTNHLGHFAFTGHLMPLLLSRPGARVVTVTSFLMHTGRLRLDDAPARTARAHNGRAHSESKLANLMFAVELQRRLVAAGVGAERLISTAAHPGLAATRLQTTASRAAEHRIQAAVLGMATRVLAQSAAAGALPLLFAATAPSVAGGGFYGPRFLEYRGAPHRAGGAARAYAPSAGEILWANSENTTGVRYHALRASA